MSTLEILRSCRICNKTLSINYFISKHNSRLCLTCDICREKIRHRYKVMTTITKDKIKCIHEKYRCYCTICCFKCRHNNIVYECSTCKISILCSHKRLIGCCKLCD